MALATHKINDLQVIEIDRISTLFTTFYSNNQVDVDPATSPVLIHRINGIIRKVDQYKIILIINDNKRRSRLVKINNFNN